MGKQESTYVSLLRRFIGLYLFPLIGVGTTGLLSTDQLLLNGRYLVNPVMTFANANQQALSVIFSGMLVFAYLMQYQNQRSQRKIMDTQIQLMSAGYTPIVGVSDREWGAQREDRENIDELDTEDANRLFLGLSNTGNSTARNLQVWIGIDYNDSEELGNLYRSYCTSLRRTSNTSWWHTDKGGALASTPDETTIFQADLQLSKEKKRWFRKNKSQGRIPIHIALEDLEENGIETAEIALILQYTTTTNQEEEIELGAFEVDLPSLKEDDMWLYRAMEMKEEDVDRIKQESY